LAITAGTMVAYWVTGQLGRAAGPSGQGTVKTVIYWLVVALFLFLMVRIFPRRKDTKRPKWMDRLQHGLSGQLDLAREVGCRSGRAAGSGAAAPSGAFAQLTHQQRACGAGCRTPASSHPGTWPYSGTVSVATLVPTVHGRPGVVMRVRTSADRSVMGMLVSTFGLLPAATGKAAAPPRRQTMAPKPPLDRDIRRK
jgi:hypothetical protein